MIPLELLDYVANYGFAAVVAIYSLTTLSKTMKENTKAINDLRLLIVRVIK